MSAPGRPYRFACVQVNAGDDMAANIAAASGLIEEARGEGADFIGVPENVSMMAFGSRRIRGSARDEADHPALAAFRELAARTGAWLLVGSLTVRIGEADGRVANRGYVIDGSGGIAARYDKIGLTICYDLRFAHLYRTLAQSGAHLLTVPAAFTRVTGAAHWHVLLRARAIETGCFVAAPAQCGVHPGGRETFGHSLVVDPWGKVLADAGTEPGFVIADIDPAACIESRAMVPALTHDRPYRTATAAREARAAG